jgi:5-methylthioadenosine/S-adenosylhomocysteine deaminase
MRSAALTPADHLGADRIPPVFIRPTLCRRSGGAGFPLSVVLATATLLFVTISPSRAVVNAQQVAGAAAQQVDTLIRGGTVVAMDAERRVIERGAVAIRDGRIVAVGPAEELTKQYASPQVIEADGRLIIPGLVNTHGHAAMSLMRGLADDRALMDWLENFIFPAEAKLVDEPFVRAGTRLACLEMLLGGTTTYVDMYYFEDAVADETAKAGMRGVLGQTLIDFPAPDFKTWDASLAGCEAFLKKWKDHPLITPAAAPHAPYTVSPEHLQAIKDLTDRAVAPIVIHVAETKNEVQTIRERFQTTPVTHLDRLGVLGPRVIAAHMVHPTDDELPILKKHSVGVAHCPQSNMKLASGIAPLPKMLTLDIAVGLGTDGPASNNDLDLWEEIDTAAKLHKVATGDPTVISAREAFTLATIGGARAIHQQDRIGSLEPGKQADVVIVAVDGPHQTPLYDVYSHLAYAVKASDVRTVLVAGKVVVEEREPKTLNAKAILEEARKYRDKVRAAVKM